VIILRKSLGHLPLSWRDQLLKAVIAKAECGALSISLQRIYTLESEFGLEFEFWFQGCSDAEASQCVAATIRDAAAACADSPLSTA
jgi:hypothetical protein